MSYLLYILILFLNDEGSARTSKASHAFWDFLLDGFGHLFGLLLIWLLSLALGRLFLLDWLLRLVRTLRPFVVHKVLMIHF